MAVGHQRVVTPEAVVLSFETAGLGSRVLAALVDLAVQGGALFLGVLALTVFGATAQSDAVGVAVFVLLLLLVTGVLLGYPIAFETLWRGRTPGKAALGLRVVTTDGAPIRFRHAAVRGFLGLIDLWATTGAVAVVSVLLSRDDQRLGDLAAGTLVLRERSGAGTPTATEFRVPPGLEAYTSTLDVAGLTPEEYGAVRSFLLRAGSLPPEVRASLAASVAERVAVGMHHRRPDWLPADAFLACVAAATQAGSARVPTASVRPSEAAAVWARAEAPTTALPGPDSPQFTPSAPPPPPPSAGGFQLPG